MAHVRIARDEGAARVEADGDGWILWNPPTDRASMADMINSHELASVGMIGVVSEGCVMFGPRHPDRPVPLEWPPIEIPDDPEEVALLEGKPQ